MKPAFECATCTDPLATTAQEDHQPEETGGGLRGPLLTSANLLEDWRMKFQ